MFVRKKTYLQAVDKAERIAESRDRSVTARYELLEELDQLRDSQVQLKLVIKTLLSLRGRKVIPVETIRLLKKNGL